MKRFFFIPALCLFLASCGGDEGTKGGGVPSLKVEPSSLTFAAVSAPSQSVTVTAEHVDWEVRVSETASSWLKAEKTDGTTVTVSVTDNDTPDERRGSFTVAPTNNEDVKAKSVTVTQSGDDVEYTLTVEPASLTFEAEGAAAQTVTVTAEGGLTWEAAADGDAASWITVTPGEGTLEIKVADNPEATERSGNVVVTPSVSSVGPKAIRVTQAGKVFPPSLSIDVEDPETGFTVDANGNITNGSSSIHVTAVNTDWNVRAVDAEDKAVTWLGVDAHKESGVVNVYPARNETFEDRVGYVLITAAAEGVPEIRVRVAQAGLKEHYSTLTADVVLDNLTHADGVVTPCQEWYEPERGAYWKITLWTDGVEETEDYQHPYAGTGTYIELAFSSERIPFNDDNEYYMTAGEYTVGGDASRMVAGAGTTGYYEWQHPGCWVFILENGVVTEKAPLTAGTIAVSRDGDRYTFTFDCRDDFEFTVTGTSSMEFVPVCQSSPQPKPPVGSVE